MIKNRICSEEDKEIFNDKEKKDYMDLVISNPIHVYKLMKQMHWFAEEVYNPKIETVSSNKGKFAT